MMQQIVIMGLWLTAVSFFFLKAPFFDQFFANTEQKLTAYFVLFIWSALFNGFNVRDDGFAIFKGLNENTGFMKVFVTIVLVQAFIVNCQSDSHQRVRVDQQYVQLRALWTDRLGCGSRSGGNHDSRGHAAEGTDRKRQTETGNKKGFPKTPFLGNPSTNRGSWCR